jgi:hypothetical protein
MTDFTHLDDPAVAALLAAAAAPAEGPMPGEAQALTAFRSVYTPRRRIHMPHFSEKAKLIAAAVFGGVVVISGAATAATGTLPVPGVSHGHSHANPTKSHGPDANDDENSTDTSTTDGTNDNNGKGSAVSQLAHETPPPGTTHGQMVCTFASGGQCQAGQHGQSDATTHGKAGTNDNATTHRQNTSTTHGKAGTNDNATSHRQNTSTTHGQG